MSFLDAKINLTNTIFSERDLELARDYLTGLIASEDPVWLNRPTGYLSRYWLADDLEAVCFLIELARTLSRLEMGGLNADSKTVFLKKFQALLRKISKREAFEEALTELQVAAILSERVQPVVLEPRILELKPGEKPQFAPVSGSKLIDLALLLEKETLFVEVTVFRSEFLSQWTKAANLLSSTLNLGLQVEELDHFVRLSLPFPAPPELLSGRRVNRLTARMLDRIAETQQGEAEIEIESQPVKKFGMEWDNLPGTLKAIETPIFGGIAFSQKAIMCKILREDFPVLLEVLVKSLRNSLQVKREQFQLNTPFVLVVRIGSNLLPEGLLLQLIERRLWNNSRFSWLSAIALFRPRTAFGLNDPGPKFLLSANPRAKIPASLETLAIFR